MKIVIHRILDTLFSIFYFENVLWKDFEDECPNLTGGEMNRAYFCCIMSDIRNYSNLSAWRKYGIDPKDAVDKLSNWLAQHK